MLAVVGSFRLNVQYRQSSERYLSAAVSRLAQLSRRPAAEAFFLGFSLLWTCSLRVTMRNGTGRPDAI